MVVDDELNSLTQRWKEIDDDKQREEFYEKSVFPQVRKVIRERERGKYPPLTHLILTVGLSPEPLILSIDILRPERVCFLYTPASQPFLERVIKETGLTFVQVVSFEVDETQVPQIYLQVKEIYKRWGKPADIAVDISGGKKSMVGGCALAASFIGARLFYIDSEFTDFKKPEPGSERLCLLDDPYDVFGDLEMERARTLFKELDFSAASRLLKTLNERTPTPDRYYTAYAHLCEAYAAWDSWEIELAHQKIDEAICTVKRLGRLDRDTPLMDRQNILENQAKLLERLEQSLSQPDNAARLQNPAHYLPLMATLRACALRQHKRQKLDTAALLWYRLLELLIQQRLSAVYQLDSKSPDYTSLQTKHPRLLQAYKQSFKKIGRKEPAPSLPAPISLVEGYLLLDALKDPLTHKVPPRRCVPAGEGAQCGPLCAWL